MGLFPQCYHNIGYNQGQQGNSFAGSRRHFQKTVALRGKIGEILKRASITQGTMQRKSQKRSV